jgi:3D (Asp-Asp-Asp) domain-containing protein
VCTGVVARAIRSAGKRRPVVVQKTEDMIVRQRRVVGAAIPTLPVRPLQAQRQARGSTLVGRRLPVSTAFAWFLAASATVGTAIAAKELGPAAPMAALDSPSVLVAEQPSAPEQVFEAATAAPEPAVEVVAEPAPAMPVGLPEGVEPDTSMRWFNGRPVRPARTITMRVTAYSPDAASCWPYADGQTATLHGVDTNGGFLVAADTDMLPFGSMLSIDGYAGGDVVPVLDRGGAIKGNRLDLLFPTHEAALEWGVREIEVIVWEYADGKPADDPRKLRS